MILVVFPFCSSKGVQLPSYIFLLSRLHQQLLKAEFLFDCFLNNSSGSRFAHLIFRQADKQENNCFPFPNFSCAETAKHVEACGADVQLEGIPQCKSLKFPCF